MLGCPMFIILAFLLLTVHTQTENLYKDYARVSSPSSSSTIFAETFNDDSWEHRWVISKHHDYQGKWRVAEGSEPHTVKGDKGLIVDSEARKHAISAKFQNDYDNSDKDFVIQYELRLQKDLDCGGAYIKLLTASSLPSDLSKFSNDVPYTIMFGPDKCGSTNKVHFIIRHKNPISGEYEEKHLKNPPSMRSDTITHLYKLLIRKGDTFAISVDNSVVKEGNLLEDFEPSFIPPKEIDDPSDKKPKDWVDEAKIPDLDAVKPDDWDENAPATIVDQDDEKPLDWLDDEPLTIPDPSVSKPEDWDDDLDGDWEAPQVPNPKCQEFGCGEWKPRFIPNPEYKGKWSSPLIDNPAYIGEWHPRRIPNPNYFEEIHPHKLEPIGAIGIELWTMKDGILFDNILITQDEDEAETFTSATWTKKHADEEAAVDAEIAQKTPSIFQQLTPYMDATLKYVSNPDNLLVVVGTLVVGLVVPIILCCCIGRGEKPTQKKPKQKPEKDTQQKISHEKSDTKSSETEGDQGGAKAKKKKKHVQ